jgi:hypothetical protein
VMSLSSAGDRTGSNKFAPRKRNLEEYNSGTTTPRNDGYRNEYAGMEDTTEGWIPGSPQPFVYQLAGEMDTPSLAAAHAINANEYGDQEIALTGPIALGHEYSFSLFLARNLFSLFFR